METDGLERAPFAGQRTMQWISNGSRAAIPSRVPKQKPKVEPLTEWQKAEKTSRFYIKCLNVCFYLQIILATILIVADVFWSKG